MAPARSGLTTSQLAARTGVPAGTLRMWEARHGFPVPARADGGHRRYDDSAAAAVMAVLRLREHGLSLAAAIDRVREADRAVPLSIFAALRQRRPELAPALLSKHALLALSHAVEDEYYASATPGLVIGSFQRERFYRQSERRWLELGRSSELTVALADFATFRASPDIPAEVPVARDHPLSREWTLIVSSVGVQACVAAWERPAPVAPIDRERKFEVLWAFDPEVVHAAAEIAAETVRATAPAEAIRFPADRLAPPPPSPPELRSASALAHRVVSYIADGDPQSR